MWGDGLAAFDRGNARRYFYFNAHGDVTLITDANGDEQRRYDYDAYGEGRAVEGYSGSYLNPFRYSGEYFDEETGFYYLRARYYDPTIGRFLTEDPAGDGTNSDLRQGREETTQNRTGDEGFAEFCLPRPDMTNPRLLRRGLFLEAPPRIEQGMRVLQNFAFHDWV